MKKTGNMNGKRILAERIPSTNVSRLTKRLLLCACIIFNFHFSILNSAQAQVKWHSIEEASKAQIGDKLYFIDFYTVWCGYCKKMDRETFTDPTVAKILNRYYYPVKFNAESPKAVTWFGHTYNPGRGRSPQHEFAAGLRGYPTYCLYRANGKPFQAIPGFYSAAEFTVILWYFASGDCDRYPFERYSQIFDKEIRPQMEKALK
ncbi:MAG: DUF255 domain-containing protein [Bacteroidales bacterium]|nr:DUF255 domain-containing protein [Bacteroidales bacterium]